MTFSASRGDHLESDSSQTSNGQVKIQTSTFKAWNLQQFRPVLHAGSIAHVAASLNSSGDEPRKFYVRLTHWIES